MKNKISFIVLFCLVALSTSCSLWLFFSRPNVGIIRSNYLIDNYEGMKETRELLDEKEKKYQQATDSLKALFMSELEIYNRDSSSFNSEEKKVKIANLQRLNIEFYKASENQKNNNDKTQQDLIYGILNQMNTHIQSFGKEKGFDIIYGTTTEGNVLFSSEAYDITEEALRYINSKHLNE